MSEADAVGRAFLNFNPRSVVGARSITVARYPEDDMFQSVIVAPQRA